jgi:aspartyl protease
MPPLADYLAQFDYAAVPLVRTSTGHLYLQASAVNGRPTTLCLDTGAGRTVVGLELARELGLALEEDARGAGMTGAASVKNYRTSLASLGLGPLVEENFPARAVDLAHVNEALRQRGAPRMDGVIGADLLDAREAVIEYRHLQLYLKRAAGLRLSAG